MLTEIKIRLNESSFLNVSRITRDDCNNQSHLIYHPGLAAQIDSDIQLLSQLRIKNIYVIHPRGRGLSSVNSDDYSLNAHTKDLQHIINYLSLNTYSLICYSYASLYGISLFQFGLKFVPPKRLILCDYPAKEKKLDRTWVDFMSKRYSHLPRSFYESFAFSSDDSDLSDTLSVIPVPVTLFKGGHAGIPESLLTDQDLESYTRHVKTLGVEKFQTGHFFKDHEPDLFIEKIFRLVNYSC